MPSSRRRFLKSGMTAGAVAAANVSGLPFAAASAAALQSPNAGRRVDLDIDVTNAAALGEKVQMKVTVVLPRPSDMPSPPVVAFGFPGGGYSRHYYTFDMPGSQGGGQAGWH